MSIPYDSLKTSLYNPSLRPTVFNQAVAAIDAGVCAEISRLAYWPFETDTAMRDRLVSDLRLGGLTLCDTFNQSGTQAILVQHFATGQYVLAFRGTEMDVTDIGTDLTAWQEAAPAGAGRVHAGFKHALAAIWPSIKATHGHLLAQLVLTGHSLGGALATLAASDIALQNARHTLRLITIGSPAAGNPDFVTTLSNVATERYVNCCDIVPCLPPELFGFWHVGTARYIDRAGVLNARLPDDVSSDQMQARLEYLVTHAWKIGHVGLRDLADHSPTNYIRALWRGI